MQILRGMSRFFVILAAVLGLLLSATPAQATQVPSSAGVSVSAAAFVQPYSAKKGSCKDLSANGQAASSSSMLPSTRWQDSSSTFHSRVDSGFMGSPKWVTIERAGIVTSAMTMGNMLWGWATGLAQSAINFCMADSAFGVIDKLAGSLGKIVTDNMIVAILLVASLLGGIFTLYKRGRFPIGEFMMRVGAVALLMIMVAGATSSTGGGINGSDKAYKAGKFSPGWMVIETQTAVNTIAAAPLTSINDLIGKNKDKAAGGGFCEVYASTLNSKYKDQFGSHSATPRSLSKMWEMSGLEAWKGAQYGLGPMSKNVWCMQLEWYGPTARLGSQKAFTSKSFTEGPNAGSVAEVINVITKKNGQTFDLGSKAFSPQNDVDRDRSIVAWAVCEMKKGGDLKKAEGWDIREEATSENFKPEAKDCAGWWSSNVDELKAFDWPTSPEEIREKGAGNPVLIDFIENVHGEVNTVGKSSSMTFAIASIPMLIVFGFLGLATYGANAGIMLIMMALIVAVMMACVPIPGSGIKSIGKVMMTLLGLILFSLFVRGLFTIITIISEVMVQLGSHMLDGALQMLWTGLAPVLSVVALHFIFTKALKMPSPFTLSGGAAWGKALGGGGGSAALNGMNSMTGKVDSKIGSATKAGSRKAGGAAISAIPGMGGVGSKISGTTNKRKGAAGARDSQESTGASAGGSNGAESGSSAPGGTKKRPSKGGAKPRSTSMAQMAADGRATRETESVAVDLESGAKVDLDGSGRRGGNPLEDGTVDGGPTVGAGGPGVSDEQREGEAIVVDSGALGGNRGAGENPLEELAVDGGAPVGPGGPSGGEQREGEAIVVDADELGEHPNPQEEGEGEAGVVGAVSGAVSSGGRVDAQGNRIDELAVDVAGTTGPSQAGGRADREGMSPVMNDDGTPALDQSGGQIHDTGRGYLVGQSGKQVYKDTNGVWREAGGSSSSTPKTSELPIIPAPLDPTAGMKRKDRKDFNKLGYTKDDISDSLANTELTNKELLASTSNFRERGVMRKALKVEAKGAKKHAKANRAPMRTRIATSVMEPLQHMRENPGYAAKTIAKGAAVGIGAGLAATVLLPASPLLIPAAALGVGVVKSRVASRARQRDNGKGQSDKLAAYRDAQRLQRDNDEAAVNKEQEKQSLVIEQRAEKKNQETVASQEAVRNAQAATQKADEQKAMAAAIAQAMGGRAADPGLPNEIAEPRDPLVVPKQSFEEANAPEPGRDG